MSEISIKKRPSCILISIICSLVLLMIVNIAGIIFLFEFDIASKLDSKTVNTIVLQKSEISELKMQIKDLNDTVGNFKKQKEALLSDTVAYKRKINQLNGDNEALLNEKNALLTDMKKLNEQLNKIPEMPIFIKSLKIGNQHKGGKIETNYGDKLYSNNAMYLGPQIEYVCIGSNQDAEIELFLNIYENGVLYKPTDRLNNPNLNYTYTTTLKINAKDTIAFPGFGNDSRRYWKVGQYRYEIWYKDMCLKSVDFEIHPPRTLSQDIKDIITGK